MRELGLAIMLVCFMSVFFLFPFHTHTHSLGTFRNQKRELGLAMMLVCVVIVFFLCNFLALVANVLEVNNKKILC